MQSRALAEHFRLRWFKFHEADAEQGVGRTLSSSMCMADIDNKIIAYYERASPAMEGACG
jgi:hypothetical protein